MLDGPYRYPGLAGNCIFVLELSIIHREFWMGIGIPRLFEWVYADAGRRSGYRHAFMAVITHKDMVAKLSGGAPFNYAFDRVVPELDGHMTWWDTTASKDKRKRGTPSLSEDVSWLSQCVSSSLRAHEGPLADPEFDPSQDLSHPLNAVAVCVVPETQFREVAADIIKDYEKEIGDEEAQEVELLPCPLFSFAGLYTQNPDIEGMVKLFSFLENEEETTRRVVGISPEIVLPPIPNVMNVIITGYRRGSRYSDVLKGPVLVRRTLRSQDEMHQAESFLSGFGDSEYEEIYLVSVQHLQENGMLENH
ncbi:hypothetical protein B0H63DRAFT_523771 [Podospora didyma]|uniref:Uncharacterized protein n=1 Tax=Podospora didyma TaxID=330526 RepID=A0AAE0TVJ7_9PEZI|nr:hypothetical protein B0H63DRAFT_523771 [Podospora didyma]